MTQLTGRCLCGGVNFAVEGPVQGKSVCHCPQCRRQSGHLWASGYVTRDRLSISGTSLTWYRSSDTAQRGFCNKCGTFLFWAADAEDTMSFSLGALDAPTGLTLEKHIFVSGKGDYYEITDGLPQRDR